MRNRGRKIIGGASNPDRKRKMPEVKPSCKRKTSGMSLSSYMHCVPLCTSSSPVTAANLFRRLPCLVCLALAFSTCLVARVVRAQQDGLTLATARHCMACHQVAQKRVGPAFILIRDRFLADPAAIPHLAQSIRQGGRGRWGVVPMPAQPQVSPIEAQTLAQWILQLKPETSP